MSSPGETFANLCGQRQLSADVLTDASVATMARLVLENADYAVPVLAAFKHLALPIAAEWILNDVDLACKTTAFCRMALLCPLWPPLQPLMEHFLAMNAQNGYVSVFFDSEDIDNVLISLIRLLLHDYGRFSGYFSAELLRDLAAAQTSKQTRALALQALGLLTQVSEAVVDKWITGFAGGDHAHFEFNIMLLEAQRKASDVCVVQATELLPASLDYENTLVANVENVFVPRFGHSSPNPVPFVRTDTAVQNLRRMAVTILKDKPLLLTGEPGSGKTFFAEVLHSKVRTNSDIVRIHLGDQTDAKALVGTYTTGSTPGTFEWSPGALTTAVKAGKWVLVEDIDRAPTDIVAVLLPLIDRRELVVPSRNQVIKAAPGFQLVATTTNSQMDVIGSRGWARSEVTAPSDNDLLEIISGKRPFLARNIINMLLDTFRRIQEFQASHSLVRRATTRDLFKLVARVTPRYDSDDLFRETIACFASFLADSTQLANVVADAMGFPASKVDPILSRHKPSISLTQNELVIGRATVERRPVSSSAARNAELQIQASKFALTSPTLRLLEEVAVSVAHEEPVLLVGETGTGKTSVVQYLAQLARRKLVVINVSQQVEAGDLIGGFKPVDARQLAGAVLDEFNELFDSTFSRAKNHQFLDVLERTVARQQWGHVVKLLREAIKMATPQKRQGGEAKRPRLSGDWAQFSHEVDAFDKRLKEVQQQAQFQFIEGLLVRAMRQGHWVLLDEFNLAPADTLEGIGELVSSRSLTLLERGGEVVTANSAFRLFANMNPATDVGKRDLPPGVRAQFTEIWAPSPDSDSEALRAIVASYLPQGTQLSVVNDVCALYMDSKELSESHQLVDGAGQRPHFSVRTLSRALVCAVVIAPRFGLRRALFEAFSMCFLTLLDDKSALTLSKAIDARLLEKLPNRNSVLSQTPPEPQDGHRYTQFKHWWMPTGSGVPQEDAGYIVTPFVERNLLNLVRATATKLFPVLIQGPTSSGKTSMITHLAKRTGHTVVRINNHEHTDLAEYLGGYESDTEGKLVFKEGALVTALRQGHWLVLDELNLAPTDVLEALNRLLDDNRELLIPETQEIIRPHPDFILFATQNPPGLYAGRKVLSRAFRNRFLELHFGDIPESELEIILRDRSRIAPSYAAKIVEIYRELGRQRSGSRVFEHPATLRDLFRWANRPAIGYEQLAQNGFALLAERTRSPAERELVRSVISTVMRVPVDVNYADMAPQEIMDAAPSNIVWTAAMRRVLTLVHLALMQNEPVLLVGETGCGKTTIVQAIAAARHQRLTILNAHQNTETGDLVGSQRPARHGSSSRLFEWVDGPLVKALKNGDFFLLDEISLADDSVLERLNSVLEADRTLFVPEIGSFQADDGFQFLATMNPGGDYGKKELSPALRNRFTEIWVPSVDSEDDLKMIVRSRLQSVEDQPREKAVDTIVAFSQYFSSHFGLVSLRDVLSWTQFVGTLGVSESSLVQGASMVFIDGLGSNAYAHLASQPETLARAKVQCLAELEKYVGTAVDVTDAELTISDAELSIGGFCIPRIAGGGTPDFSFSAPTAALNAMRVLRAMQSKKPVLLEGSPGAGKTSLVAALAEATGRKLTRINLSDQTDLADLFGSDIPLDKPGQFGWRDAPFLRAMQKGEWVLLDEMNLAPQQVLEGLNACLDHRGEVYVPELDQKFKKHPDFVVFAAQNPHAQGGGRKGLPKSFVNRFAVVYVQQLGLDDLHAIAASVYPAVDASIREPLAAFVEELAQWATTRHVTGGPFEFNLRDTMRWLDLVARTGEHPSRFLALVVTQRFRTKEDREYVESMFRRYFKEEFAKELNPVNITPNTISFGGAEAERSNRTFSRTHLGVLTGQIEVLETATYCIRQRWPLILVGSSGSGKTSVIRLLAQLCGARLHEFAMTADVDSTDLLGEFDQVEEQSQLQRLWSEFEELVEISDISSATLVDAVRSRDLDAAVSLLPEGHVLIDMVHDFRSRDYTKPTFQWFDGMLVRAVELGHWLVLDNANLCSPAVLDRLNSLLERGGTLLVNECAEADGSPREVRPHPNFRLFMTVDPRYGELSRAMRNRGTEVWLSPDATKSWDQAVAEQRTIAGALSVSHFSRPFNAAKFADLQHRRWLRALLLDSETAHHVDTVDFELNEFFRLFGLQEYSEGAIAARLEALQRLWSVFTTRKLLSKAELADVPTNLLELSALRRKKDSVECDFDLYGVVSYICEILTKEPLDELASIVLDFVNLEDPSRVPVFRDWLLEYGKKHNLSQFAETVSKLLGTAYDFSAGGSGMDRLWQAYSRQLGFDTLSAHDAFVHGLQIAAEFDRLVAPLGLEHADAISDIRSALLQAIGTEPSALHELEVALKAFKESLPVVEGNLVPQKLLVSQFKGMLSSFALAYTEKPSLKLRNTLARLANYADVTTAEVFELTAEKMLNAPVVEELPSFESIIISALQLDVQGAARDELVELAKIVLQHSSTIMKAFKPTELIAKIVVHNARLIGAAVPEAAGLMQEICEATRVDATGACARLASALLELYVCPLPLDPAIAQHVWYERYMRLKSDHAKDTNAWSEIRDVFGCPESDVDRWLETRELAQVPIPTVYRPEKSTASQVYRDMVAAAQLTRSSLRTALTVEESEVIKRNAAHLQERLGRASGYRDLVEPVRTALALATLSLSAPPQTSDTGSLWLLEPTTLGHSVPGSTLDYPLLVLRSLACSETLLLDPLREVLDDLYRRWTLERLRVEEERREEAAGFRYDDDDGLAAEREFVAMFPDYEQETELPRKSDDFAPRLVSIYKSLFSGSKADAVAVSVDAATELQSAQGLSSGTHVPALYLALRNRLSCKAEQSTDINFYTDSSQPESAISAQFATKVGDRVRKMLQMWPEHDALQTLLRVSDEIRSLPPAVPIALHLTKTEQLHHWLYEWDRFAAKEARVSDLISDGSSIIVRWRRLELATWPALFAVERRRCIEENARFWYNLYETLIVTPADDVSDTAKVLTVFMSEATIGQFEDRLELLKCFCKHNALTGNEEMARCIANVEEFYRQFLPAVKQRLHTTEKQLKKQVDDVIRLASWRDVNVHALKQSAQRSHRQLFKTVKKYRALLAEKAPNEATPAVDAPFVKDEPSDWPTGWDAHWVSPLREAVESIQPWSERPKPLQDVTTTATVLQSYVKRVSNVESSNLKELADNVEKRAQELQAETPKTASKETKKLVANLRVQKQQVLTATLRELRRAGLRTAVRKDVAASQMELTRVLAKTPNLSASDSPLAISEPNFFAFVELLPRLRAAVSDAANNPQIDVPFNDLQRGLAFTENIFAHMLRLRRVAAKHVAAASPRELGRALSSLAETKAAVVWDPESASQAISKAGEVVSTTSVLVERLYQSADVAEPGELARLRAATIHQPTAALQRSIVVRDWLEELSAAARSLEEHCNVPESDQGAAQLVSPIVKKLTITLSECVSSLKLVEAPASAADVDDAVTAAANTVLVVVQHVLKELKVTEASNDAHNGEASEDDAEDDEWLTLSLLQVEKILMSLRPAQVISKLQSASDLILRLSGSNTTIASAFAALLIPFVRGYFDLVRAAEIVYARALSNTVSGASKLAAMLLSLATNGFCSPEGSDGEDETEEGAEGTGLGDGTGAQSSSKDVDEEDDDVSEAMQTANPEQQERDEADDGEDNAREVEGDMAGKTEDLPPQSDEEDDEQDDKDEEEGPDDEVGDLEDLDPNAVDEKMWDDKKEETDEKEKHTDENVQGSKDEEAEARENDDDDSNEPSKEKPEDDNPEGNEEGSDVDEAEEQDEDVKQGDPDELQESTEQKDALDLPEDMELDDGDEKEGDEDADDVEEDNESEFNDPLDNPEDNPENGAEAEPAQDDDMDVDNDQQEDSAEAEGADDQEQAPDTEGADDSMQEEEADEAEDGVDDDAVDPRAEPEEMDLDEEQPQPLPEGDGEGADIEGLDGPNEEQSADQQQEQSAATDDRSNNRGQGASEDASNEEANVGTGGTSGANAEDLTEQPEDTSKKDATSESLKTLGDAMKEFHRRHRPIRERGEDEREDADGANDSERPLQGQDELEHVGADDIHDTQALGRSNEQERQSIDDKLAIDDEEEPETTKDVAGDAEEGADMGAQAGGEAETFMSEEEDHSEDDKPSMASAGANVLPDESADELPDHRVEQVEESAPSGGATDLWQVYEAKTHDLALVLGEQLRLILEPTVASKLRGDFRTGKRLNMKRIIPYIASEFRKDKIWLRRTKPAKRQYQVLLALDDSRSMGEPAVVDLAFQAIALVGTALSNIEAGQMGVAKFGGTTEFVHDLDQPFTPQAGNAVLQQFGFAQQRTNVRELLERSLEMFADHQSGGEQWRLEIIVSDGITDDHTHLRRLVRKARDERVMLVFVILDALNRDTSILNMNEVRYITDENGNQKLEVTKYMEDFPFEYYVIVRNIVDLPVVLASVLRQYFQAVDE